MHFRGCLLQFCWQEFQTAGDLELLPAAGKSSRREGVCMQAIETNQILDMFQHDVVLETSCRLERPGRV
jgi:hypothetical protein